MEDETRRLEGMTRRSRWLYGLFWILFLTAVGAAAYYYYYYYILGA